MWRRWHCFPVISLTAPVNEARQTGPPHGAARFAAFYYPRGRATVKAVPSPGPLWTVIRPRCPAAMATGSKASTQFSTASDRETDSRTAAYKAAINTPKNDGVQRMVDIAAKKAEGKGKGYEK